MRADPSQSKEIGLEEMARGWGLRCAPFAADDKSANLFAFANHREATHLLESTAALRGVMVLSGSPGAGKSTLIKTWSSNLDTKRYRPILITQSSLSASGLMEMVLCKLGERPRFKRSGNLQTLEKHLTEIEPTTMILILDDAQNYPASALEEIRMLLGLGGRQRTAFALVLLGDEYLLSSLRLTVQRALFSRISANVSLAPLNRDEIEPYLNWHVKRAGLDRNIFSVAAVDLLAEASEGNPRTLNLVAQASWIVAARSAATSIEPEHVHIALRQVPSASAKIAAG